MKNKTPSDEHLIRSTVAQLEKGDIIRLDDGKIFRMVQDERGIRWLVDLESHQLYATNKAGSINAVVMQETAPACYEAIPRICSKCKAFLAFEELVWMTIGTHQVMLCEKCANEALAHVGQ